MHLHILGICGTFMGSLALLARDAELSRIVNLVGPEALSSAQRWELESAALIKEGVLQQSAIDEVDSYASPAKQFTLMRLMLDIFEGGNELIEMGVPAERLRLTYVKALELDQAHMVLTYYETPEAEPVVLDNLVGEIRPSSQRTDLLPVYSFNGEGLWLAKTRTGNDKHVGHSSRLGPWRDVIARISDEYTR